MKKILLATLLIAILLLSACGGTTTAPTATPATTSTLTPSPTATPAAPATTPSSAAIPTPESTTTGTGAVIGQASFPDGTAAYLATVFIFKAGENNSYASCVIDSNGNYRFNNLPAGQYELWAANATAQLFFGDNPEVEITVSQNGTTTVPAYTLLNGAAGSISK